MEKFYKLARIVAFVIMAKLVLWGLLYSLLLHIQWEYNYIAYRIIDISIFALLIWTFSILIHNSENGSRIKKASILAIIGLGICIANIFYQYMSIHLYEWIDFGYVFNYTVAPLLLIVGEILLCIAILSFTRLFPRKSLVFISGIIYFVCLLMSVLSDIYQNFWIYGSRNYDFESLECHIYSAIRVYICYWLEQISLALFIFSLSRLSNKKQ